MMTTLREHVVRRLFYYRAPDPKELIAHLEAEQQRREEREKNMELIHAGTGEDAGTAAPASGSGEAPVNNGPTQLSGTPAAKSVEDERARLEAQRKARRQQSRR
jgi:hypothetical protein